ncbi:hypothetical protein OIU76_020933 [Salix suchowensis]|nr:Pentatricopeptide repeat-containing protein [Salix suchowensis]KAJ6300037.1 hypothetical protein OIU76_020933 [Salix suchowensis]
MASIPQTSVTTAITLFPISLPSQNSFYFPSKPPPTTSQPLPQLRTSHILSKPNHHHHRHISSCTSQFLLSSPLSLTKPQESSFPIDPNCHSFQTNTDCLIDVDGLFNFLRLSVKYTDIGLARALHASILKLEEDTHLGNAVIAAYIKLGLVIDAYRVFMGMSTPDVVSYSAIISSFSKLNREAEAIQLFFRMRISGIEPNEYSFVAILTACIRSSELELGLQVHALAIKMGYSQLVFVANALMGLYGKCGCLDNAIHLFDEMPQRDIASWNTMISSVVKGLSYEKALELFRVLNHNKGFKADQFTLSTLLTACTRCHARIEGRQIHAHAIRIGLENNLSVSNAIIRFYTGCGSLNHAVALFERMPFRDIITWTEMITAYMEFGLVDLAVNMFNKMPEKNSVSYNALLTGFCKNNEGLKALNLFVRMVQEGAELTDFTLTSVINACGLFLKFEISRQIHGFIVKFGFRSNACIEAALIDMCSKCGRMDDADRLYQSTDGGNTIIQTSMICGYARNGLPEEAICLFYRSQLEGTMVLDEVAFTSILGVCGTLGFHEMGKQIHCHALKTGFHAELGVGNSTISMYSKCYNIDDAIKAFNTMPAHNIVSWNGLIAGQLLHRQGDEALAIWSSMEKAGIKPDTITFVLIVSAYKYTSSNLLDECRSLFLSMKMIHGLEPTSEHYASLVGVLGYWGLLEEAEELINKMPFEPEVSVWRALLDSCRLNANTSIGKRVAKHIIGMEPRDPSTYVLVSNLYAASGRWHCSEIVRENMRDRGLRKHPCRSWVINKKKLHTFYARDKSHPQAKDIYSGLDILILKCLKAGYEPDMSFVLQEVEEQQKKNFLFYHSAKLAATYGLLKTRPGEPIRVVKNILLCRDCHSFLQYASVVTQREILFRDGSGFHCFSNGQCSCKGYW